MTAPDLTRKPISRSLRFEILRRDDYTCRYCGAKAPDVELTVDHVIPVALGGGSEPNNLATACRDCNAGKGSTPPDAALVEDVDAAAMLFGRAMERAAEMIREERSGIEERIAEFKMVWDQWTYGDGTRVPLPENWRSSVETFISHGFTGEDFYSYVRRAMESKATHDDKFKYFCGCIWRALTERQELARRLIEEGRI